MSKTRKDFVLLPDYDPSLIPKFAHDLLHHPPEYNGLLKLISDSEADFKSLPNISYLHVENDAVHFYPTQQPLREWENGESSSESANSTPSPLLHIVGDTHGQYFDVLGFFEKLGFPSPTNAFLFNGDIVDRGPQSLEIFTLLLFIRRCYPTSTPAVIFNRGNHESILTTRLYGFHAEVKKKYYKNRDFEKVFERFSEFFLTLPIASVVGNSVFVVHGGLPGSPKTTLKDIELVDRFVEPKEGMMAQLLWSDPCDEAGYNKSMRPFCKAFGPDVTFGWLKTNGLRMVLRSHQMVDGFEQMHAQRLATVFSAPTSAFGGISAAIVSVGWGGVMKVNYFDVRVGRGCTVM